MSPLPTRPDGTRTATRPAFDLAAPDQRPDLTLVHTIETHAFRAWPAPHEETHDGWLLRRAGGFTKRANSANAAVPHAGFGGVQAAAEAFYARHGLPAIFRLTPLAAPEADDALAAAGYAVFDPSRVMARRLEGAKAAQAPFPPQVEITARPTADWLQGFAVANGVAEQRRGMHHAMVRAIAPPAGFATLRQAGTGIGFGLAVCEGGMVGCYDVVIDPAHRRQGHGAALMQALLRWAQDHGATQAYLQVRDANAAARQLYAGLGFADLYRYHYRVPASAGAG